MKFTASLLANIEYTHCPVVGFKAPYKVTRSLVPGRGRRVCGILNQGTLWKSSAEAVGALNRLLKGWGEYYRYGNSSR